MPRTRKRPTPVTQSSPLSASSSPKRARHLIRRFHVLLKKQTQLQLQHDSESQHGNLEALQDVEREIEELGGLQAYQRMSSAGQTGDRGGGSEKILIGWLRELGLHERKDTDYGPKSPDGQNALRLQLLDVGALMPDNYGSCSSWIQCTPIDLHSRHPAIQEQDFLVMDEAGQLGTWDIIGLSLVLNFVPDPRKRGQMLRKAHRMLRLDGYLFLVLPMPCVSNSRYLTPSHLRALMEFVGFVEVKSRRRRDGKMAYWLYRKTDHTKANGNVGASFSTKTVLRNGNRNNFSILL